MTDEENKTHELKTHPPFFQAIVEGKKTFEVRKNDRGFQCGDMILLREYASELGGRYTGRYHKVKVTYVFSGEIWGICDGFVVMGISPITESAEK